MFAALLIVFREVLEAGLVIGVVLAATRGVPQRGLYVGAGVLGGLLAAIAVAFFASEISNLFDGAGQELLNAVILAIAVLMLGWTVIWMSVHGRQMSAEFKALGTDVAEGRKPLTALAIVVGVAVLREGFEVVLFLYGVAAGGGVTAAGIAVGAALGILAGATVAAVLYFGLAAIPLKHVFKAISVLITLLAAGLAAQAADQLQAAGFAMSLAQTVWDTSGIISDNSILGRILHALIGYVAQPSVLQLIVYVATIVVIMLLMRRADAAQAAGRSAAAGKR